MVKSRILLDRFIPLILVFVVCINLIPPIRASAADSYTISGVWVFKDWPSLSNKDIHVNFTSNGESFNRISVSSGSGSGVSYCTDGSCIVAFRQPSWFASAYKTVDFGSSPQAISNYGYEWITANATKKVSASTYSVSIDGQSVLSSNLEATSCTVNLTVYYDRVSLYFNNNSSSAVTKDYPASGSQRFVGLSRTNTGEQNDYPYGADGVNYTFTLSSSSPTLNLYSVYYYPLYVDPAGGTWDGSTDISVFWELPNTDTDEIYDPVRPGYIFSGWIHTGGGEFNDAGDPPHSFEHGTSPGYLTATWVEDVVTTYTHTIVIDGSSYLFTAENNAPPVTITVTSTGCTMELPSGEQLQTWTYTGNQKFVGIKGSDGTEYPVGSYFSVFGATGADKTSTFTVLTEPFPSYTHTIVIDGSSYLFTAENNAPPVTITVTSTGCTMSLASGGELQTWTYAGNQKFVGIKASNGTEYPVGSQFSVLGSSGTDKSTTFSVLIESDAGNDFVIPAGQYEAKKSIMTGEYVALPSWPADLGSVPFAFKSSGLNYQSMSLGVYLPTAQAQLQYGSTAAYRYAGIDLSAGFTQDAFALVYLASDQAVPEAFYNWFTSAFTRISDGLVSPTYSVTINIWNAAGTSVLRTVTYSGTLCPVATLQVTENGCIISCPGQDSIEWSTSGEFYGFRLYKVSTNAIYTPGNSYSLPGGAAADVAVDLFYADTASESQVQEVFSGVSSFLVQPIMVFFNIEFIPGLSFSRIAMFAFLLGLVWWFLKVSK